MTFPSGWQLSVLPLPPPPPPPSTITWLVGQPLSSLPLLGNHSVFPYRTPGASCHRPAHQVLGNLTGEAQWPWFPPREQGCLPHQEGTKGLGPGLLQRGDPGDFGACLIFGNSFIEIQFTLEMQFICLEAAWRACLDGNHAQLQTKNITKPSGFTACQHSAYRINIFSRQHPIRDDPTTNHPTPDPVTADPPFVCSWTGFV